MNNLCHRHSKHATRLLVHDVADADRWCHLQEVCRESPIQPRHSVASENSAESPSHCTAAGTVNRNCINRQRTVSAFKCRDPDSSVTLSRLRGMIQVWYDTGLAWYRCGTICFSWSWVVTEPTPSVMYSTAHLFHNLSLPSRFLHQYQIMLPRNKGTRAWTTCSCC